MMGIVHSIWNSSGMLEVIKNGLNRENQIDTLDFA